MDKDGKELRISTFGVGIFGIDGKTGGEVRRVVTTVEDMEVAGGVDLDEPRERIEDATVTVDFIHPDVVMDNIEQCVPREINMVIGTTGFNEERLAWVRELCTANPGAGALTASNSSIGMVLMTQFTARAAPFYPSVEIVELHHPNETDVPSGTSATTAGKIAATRAAAGMGPIPDATVHDVGTRGAVVDSVHIHEVRLQGFVAHQGVPLDTYDETLTIRHNSFNRVGFMPGMLTRVRWVIDHPGLIEGTETIIGLREGPTNQPTSVAGP